MVRYQDKTRIAQSILENGYLALSPDTHDRRKLTVAIPAKGQGVIDGDLEQALAIAAGCKATPGAKRYETLLDLPDKT